MSDDNFEEIAKGMERCPLISDQDTMNGNVLQIVENISRSIRAAAFECSKRRLELNHEIIEALESTVEPLKDWVETTRHGEIYRRDKTALEKVEKVLKRIKEI